MRFTRIQLVLIALALIAGIFGVFYYMISAESSAEIIPLVVETKTHVIDTNYEPIQKLAADPESVPSEDSNITRININTSDLEELQRLPRVGAKTARSILEHRKKHGAFQTISQLTAIRGIGGKSISKFKELAYCGKAEPIEKNLSDPYESESDQVSQTEKTPQTKSPSKQGKDTTDSATLKININTALADELTNLPGIGPATAAKIIKDRETNGSYRSTEDLLRIKGIGPKKLEKIKKHIVLE